MKNKSIKIKDIFSGDMIITKILQGSGRKVRIDCKRRFNKADEQNTFSEWCSCDYANKLSQEHYGKDIEDFNCYTY